MWRLKAQSKRRDATCPITAEATHTGGGGKIFKPGGKKDLQTPWYLSFPWQSPPEKNHLGFLSRHLLPSLLIILSIYLDHGDFPSRGNQPFLFDLAFWLFVSILIAYFQQVLAHSLQVSPRQLAESI
jgi:hypothetical protein